VARWPPAAVRTPSFSGHGAMRHCTASAMHCSLNVQGAITGKDVLFHSLTIVRLWGPAFYVRCLRAMVSRRSCTFLGVMTEKA
jgi:hypothetical protein